MKTLTVEEQTAKIERELPYFSGSEEFYRHWLGLIYTEGIQYLAEEAGAYWLIDLIASHQGRNEVGAKCEFQIWNLTVAEHVGRITMREDSAEPFLWDQKIPFTDFPLKETKLYVTGGKQKTLMLPSEY